MIIMAAIGSLVFCTDCGNLLDGSSGDENAILKCDVCGNENRGRVPAVISDMGADATRWAHRYIN